MVIIFDLDGTLLNIDITAIAERFRALERDEVKQNGILFPDAKAVLENLKTKGHRLVICSCGSREYISLVLRETKIIDCFDGVYRSREYQSKTEALAGIVRYEKQAVYVGDTAEDATAADNNDIPFIGALYGYGFVGGVGKGVEYELCLQIPVWYNWIRDKPEYVEG